MEETVKQLEQFKADPTTARRQYEAQLEAWLERLETAELFAFDTETTSLDYMQAEIVGVSFALEPGRAAYVPLAHRYPGAPDQLDRESVLARLKPLLEDPGKAKLGHHLKYDAHVLANHGIALAGMRYDSMLESYVLNSTATRHDMDSCAERYLGLRTIHFEDVAGKGAKQITFDQVALEEATPGDVPALLGWMQDFYAHEGIPFDVGRSETALRELRYAFRLFAPYAQVRKVAIFGSARTPPEHPDYHAARVFSAAGRVADRVESRARFAGIDWKPGDEAVMAEQDYGAMLDMFTLQARRYGIVNRVVSLPINPQSDEEVVQLYESVITPKFES